MVFAPDRVAVTGAQQFDHWFTWQPTTSREAFCARVGLDATQPYLLYLCSSKFVAPDETAFVRQWIQQLRDSSSPALRRAGCWSARIRRTRSSGLSSMRAISRTVAIYPRAGAIPIDAASKADYFDSIYHSAAVVGINTTAEIESAIVGRQVYTLLAPEFHDTQEGTLHFHYLREAGGGLVHVARDFRGASRSSLTPRFGCRRRGRRRDADDSWKRLFAPTGSTCRQHRGSSMRSKLRRRDRRLMDVPSPARGASAAAAAEAPCRSCRARREPSGVEAKAAERKAEKPAGERSRRRSKRRTQKRQAGRSRRTSLTIALDRRTVRDASRQHDPPQLHERRHRPPVEVQELDPVRTLPRGRLRQAPTRPGLLYVTRSERQSRSPQGESERLSRCSAFETRRLPT